MLLDVYLGDLALRSPEHRKMARALARMQVLVWNRYGHIVDLRSEACRRVFERDLLPDQIPGVTIHCIRCGCVARTAQWMLASTVLEDSRQAWIDTWAKRIGPRSMDCCMSCRGQAEAERIAELLR